MESKRSWSSLQCSATFPHIVHSFLQESEPHLQLMGSLKSRLHAVSLRLEVVRPTCHEAAGLGLLFKGWQWKVRGDHIMGQWPHRPGHSTPAGQPGDSSSCWQSQQSPGKCEMAGQVQVESMKFSEQKLQDIGLGTCLPATQLRKGLEAKAGAETELPLQLCWQACTSVSLQAPG